MVFGGNVDLSFDPVAGLAQHTPVPPGVGHQVVDAADLGESGGEADAEELVRQIDEALRNLAAVRHSDAPALPGFSTICVESGKSRTASTGSGSNRPSITTWGKGSAWRKWCRHSSTDPSSASYRIMVALLTRHRS